MDEFYLYPKDDPVVFNKLCLLFEKTYPHFEKELLLIDPLDDQLFQAYHFQDMHAIIVLERVWFYEIILKANFNPEEFVSLAIVQELENGSN